MLFYIIELEALTKVPTPGNEKAKDILTVLVIQHILLIDLLLWLYQPFSSY